MKTPKVALTPHFQGEGEAVRGEAELPMLQWSALLHLPEWSLNQPAPAQEPLPGAPG